jgi:hypothetical protein
MAVSVMAVGSAAGTMLATLCVAGVAMAEDRPFDGRWISEKQDLTLDLSRCGDGWCGVEVTAPGSCGRTVLRAASGTENESDRLIGRLELAAQARPYAVAMHLSKRRPGDPDALIIRGNTGGQFDAWRRTYPYMVAFARTGDPTCHDPKVS